MKYAVKIFPYFGDSFYSFYGEATAEHPSKSKRPYAYSWKVAKKIKDYWSDLNSKYEIILVPETPEEHKALLGINSLTD